MSEPVMDSKALVRLEEKIEALKVQLTKLDEVPVFLASMKTQQDHARETTKRLFERIEALEVAAREHDKHDHVVHGSIEKHISTVERKINQVIWVGAGAAGAVTLLWGIFSFVFGSHLTQVIESLEALAS